MGTVWDCMKLYGYRVGLHGTVWVPSLIRYHTKAYRPPPLGRRGCRRGVAPAAVPQRLRAPVAVAERSPLGVPRTMRCTDRLRRERRLRKHGARLIAVLLGLSVVFAALPDSFAWPGAPLTFYYRSGAVINQLRGFGFGYIEARIKGASRWPGVCPAFWLCRFVGFSMLFFRWLSGSIKKLPRPDLEQSDSQ